jgi:ectoine hydroxylase-related dioxygenase (phytanoyl-CoA dioxygenase family)
MRTASAGQLTMNDLDGVRSRLDEVGYCVVEGAVEPHRVEELKERLVEQAAGERAAGVAHLEWEGANQRLWMLPAKGSVFRDLVLHPLIDEVMSHLLGRSFLLSSLTANIAGKGGQEMFLHSDQGYISFPTPRPVVANIMWMLSDFTADNGATRLVPGSHLREENIAKQGLPDGDLDVVAATGPAGSALVFDGRIWHGTGRNVTDEPRYGILSYHCRPWVRQQENHFLALPDDVVDSASPELLRRLGWHMWAGLGKTGQGQQNGDAFVERVTAPILELDASGVPKPV